MLKYQKCDVVFQEIPNEMSLAIAISGCTIRCKGCHSRELWEDKGMLLDVHTIDHLLYLHSGVTCLLLLGGEHDMDNLTELFMYAHRRVKTAWYSGLDRLPRQHQGIIQYLDFYKEGHFDMELGGLDSPTTNQRLYQIEHQGDGHYWQTDITHLFWRDNDKNGETTSMD